MMIIEGEDILYNKVFGEDIAILAGDALFNQAIILAAETLSISNRNRSLKYFG